MTITDTDQGIEVAVTEWLSTWQTLTIIVQREPVCSRRTAEVLPLEEKGKAGGSLSPRINPANAQEKHNIGEQASEQTRA